MRERFGTEFFILVKDGSSLAKASLKVLWKVFFLKNKKTLCFENKEFIIDILLKNSITIEADYFS